VRDLYGLPWVPLTDPALRLGVYALCRALNVVVPPSPPVREALARARGLSPTAA
jgi:hypothetical protein